MELNVACLEFSRETNTESPALIECHPKTPATRLYAHSVLRGGSRESRLAGTPSSRSCAASPGWLNLRDLSNSPVERYQGCCMFSVVELWTAVRTKNPGMAEFWQLRNVPKVTPSAMHRLIPWSRKRDNSTVSGAPTVGGGNDSEEIDEQLQLQEPAIVCQVAEVPLASEDQAPPLQLPFDNNRIPVTLEGPHKGIPGFSRGSTPNGPVLLKRPCTAYRAVDREDPIWRQVPLHQHILRFSGACKVTRQWYYVVQHYPKLSPMLVHLHTDPEADRGALILQVCDALKALHASNIVHGQVGIARLLVSDKDALLYDFCKSQTHQTKGFEEDVFDLGITIAEILKGKQYNHKKIRLLGKYPRQPPWDSPIRALYGPVWDIATDCWSPNPSSRPTIPEVFESLSKSLAPARVTEPPVSGSDTVLGDRPPLEYQSSTLTVPRPVPPPEPQTPFTTPNQLVRLPSVPSAPTPTQLMLAQEADGEWIECAPYGFFNLPVRRYRRLEGIPRASAGFSDVWKCKTTYESDGSEQLVAEKVLRAETRMIFFTCLEKFIHEIAIWGNLHHPRIAPLMGFTLQPSIALISPWYENGNVDQYMQALRRGKEDCNRLKLLHEIAQGLTYLHEFTPPVVHGDIKPDNILIDDNGSALIIDFGLSRSLVESIPGLISFNRGMGNVRWMAPETVGGKLPKSLQSDVYSFASLALNILTGAFPFRNSMNDAALTLALASASPPHPASPRQKLSCKSALETPIWTLLDECWATNPAGRPTMRDIKGRIQKLREHDDALAEAHGVSNDPPFPTGDEDKGVAAKEKKQCDQHDVLPEKVNQVIDEKPPLIEPPSWGLPFPVA